MTQLLGELNGRAKLSAAEVVTIRRRYKAGGVLERELAAEHGVHQTANSHIVTCARWSHLPYDPERPSREGGRDGPV